MISVSDGEEDGDHLRHQTGKATQQRVRPSPRLTVRTLGPPSVSVTPLTTRSSSSSRLFDLDWTSTEALRGRHSNGSGGAHHADMPRKNGRLPDKRSAKATFDLASPGQDERGSGEPLDGKPSTCECLEVRQKIDDMIKQQTAQPMQLVDSLDLDSLLVDGIADYDFVRRSTDGGKDASVSHSNVVLGQGKFSKVLLVKKRGIEYAMKHTPLYPHHPLIATRLLREPTILAQLLPHPNLVKVHETIRTPGHFYLIEESLGAFVTLEELVTSFPAARLPFRLARQVIDQLSSVVKSLHDPIRVCHRDIKPENILVKLENQPGADSPKLVLKLLDFGLATHFSASEPKLSTCCGSPAYHAPELWRVLHEPSGSVKYWGPEIDVWTIGMTMLRCLGPRRYPLGTSHDSLRQISDKVTAALLDIDEGEIRSIIAGFLDMDGSARMKNFDTYVSDQGVRRASYHLNEAREFKTTSFVPTIKRYSLNLEVYSPYPTATASSNAASRESSRSRPAYRHNLPLPALYSPTEVEDGLTLRSETSSALPSPTFTPSLKSLQMALPEQLQASADDLRAALARLTEIVLLNHGNEPVRRCSSYVKYALRCAGILYHSRGVLSPDVANEDYDANDELSVYYYQCVMPWLEPEPNSKASTALRAALRPSFARSATEGGAPLARSASTPPEKSKNGKGVSMVRALPFYMSVQKATPHSHPHLYLSTKSKPGRRSSRKRELDLIVITLSDTRAVRAVRDALNAPTGPASPENEGSSHERGRPAAKRSMTSTSKRSTSLQNELTHDGSGRAAPGSRGHVASQPDSNRSHRASEALGLDGLGTPTPTDEDAMSAEPAHGKGSAGGFFDLAFARILGKGSERRSRSADAREVSRQSNAEGDAHISNPTAEEQGRIAASVNAFV